MKRLIFAAILLAALSVGCDTDKKTLAPVAQGGAVAYSAADGDGIVVKVEWTKAVDAEGDSVLVKIETRKYGPNLMRILYIADFPMGYYGPPAPGHCYEDGSACTGPPISDCRILQCAPQLGVIGTPIAANYLDGYEAQRWQGDPDATGDQARKLGDPDADEAKVGDPDGSGVKALGDPDDTGNRATQFGPPPDKGDPTADD